MNILGMYHGEEVALVNESEYEQLKVHNDLYFVINTGSINKPFVYGGKQIGTFCDNSITLNHHPFPYRGRIKKEEPKEEPKAETKVAKTLSFDDTIVDSDLFKNTYADDLLKMFSEKDYGVDM